jgi:aldehyde:ferredoxin oxidoreductase
MVKGYMGKILNVDLSSGEIVEELLAEDLCRDFIGGYGIGAKILYDRMRPGAGPLGPENILGFMTGPFTGTPALLGSRYQVFAKSPLTDTWGDASSGGYFGPHLKFAGVDGILFSGISEKPVYLLIDEGEASLCDAGELWGKDCYETENTLREQLGDDVRMVCIGPGGEKLSLISCVINDKGRAAGRSGLGAVMGSKKLKAIAVKGELKVPLADEEQVKRIRHRVLQAKGEWWEMATQYGTAGETAGAALSGDSPVKNWAGASTVDFPIEMAEKISDDAVIAHQEKRWACWRCSIACGGTMKLDEGKYALDESENHRGHKPEYETLAMFGTLLLNDDVEAINKLNEICNKYGLDTISVGATIGFAIECYENRLITKQDTDGLELAWGDAEIIVTLAERLADREGFGDLLADGAKVAAERIGKGAEKYAMHIGGQELPAHDPKFFPGLATTYVVDATPGRHTQSSEDWWPSGWAEDLPEKYHYGGRGEIHSKLANYMHLLNASGGCMVANDVFDNYVAAVPEFLNAITGWDLSFEDCLEIGERIANLRHAFNLREGHNIVDRRLPGRVTGDPPLSEGNVQGITVDVETLVYDFLDAMGWDRTTALPSRKRLEELGLGYVAHDLAIVE